VAAVVPIGAAVVMWLVTGSALMLLFAALGPLVLGGLHDLSDAWVVPWLLLTALLVPQAVSAYLAGRPALVGGAAARLERTEGRP
jgi:cyanate permease